MCIKFNLLFFPNKTKFNLKKVATQFSTNNLKYNKNVRILVQQILNKIKIRKTKKTGSEYILTMYIHI